MLNDRQKDAINHLKFEISQEMGIANDTDYQHENEINNNK